MTTGILKKMTVIGAALVCAASCVYVDDNLGQNFIPGDQIYEVRTATFDLDGIRMGYSDSLSAYSSSRITVGAIRDSKFGLTSRSSAFTIVPVVDTIDVGENPRVTQFHFTVSRDTTSVEDEGQTNILQNIYVHRLEHVLDSTYLYTVDLNDKDFIGKETITRGIPVYNGGDSLSFDFSDDFAMEMVKLFQEDPDIQMDLDEYLEKMPGIYIRSDAPATEGGRINMFNCPIEVSDSYYVTGNYAELKIRSDYGTRKDVDTSFLFYFGPQERTTDTEQYAFNICDSHPEDRTFLIEDTENKTRSILYTATDGKIYVEGGNGLKPVISAVEIKNLLTDHLKEEGLDPDEIIVNKASVILPFDEFINSGEYDYSQNYMLPDILSPTCRFSYYSESLDNADGERIRYVSYAGLTDASVESENQGDVNLSLSRYSPDISHHVQEILRRAEDSNYSDYDIWFLTMAEETVETESGGNSALSEYYQNLAYYDYYNSMYNYGGYYGGYYGYGYNSYYGMSNYYNYMLAAQYASQSSTSVSVSMQLDKDRYYRGILRGPGADGGLSDGNKNLPRLIITYSVSKTSGK